MTSDTLTIPYVDSDFGISEFDRPYWERSEKVGISSYWNAEPAPESFQFAAQAFWSKRFLYVRFETDPGTELIISDKPQTKTKTIGVWERDVCEIFIAPNRNEPRKYFEFEIAPTGEWLDLAIDLTSGERVTNWEYFSAMEVAASIDENCIVMAMRVPWEALGRRPETGDVWLGNIFRCVGREPDRGYLAWRPTMTETPNFHVPERFGQLIFDN